MFGVDGGIKMGRLIVKVLDSVDNFLTIVADWFYE